MGINWNTFTKNVIIGIGAVVLSTVLGKYVPQAEICGGGVK